MKIVLCIIITVSFFLIGCNYAVKNEANITIGGHYKIACCPDGNPFEKVDTAYVTVTGVANNYVQYVWTHDLSKQDKSYFTRSIEDFNRMINYASVKH